MARKPRLFIPGLAAHVVQRGHSGGDVFRDDDDCRRYLGLLHEACAGHGCALHAYVLMRNHVHLLVTPEAAESVSDTLQALGRRFVPQMNTRYGRSGTLWEGRFRACLVEDSRYLLACYRYIETHPVRAGAVSAPGDYPWSSYRCNALGQPDERILPHRVYLELGADCSSRERAYREACSEPMAADELERIRSYLHAGEPLVTDEFRDYIEHLLARSALAAAR